MIANTRYYYMFEWIMMMKREKTRLSIFYRIMAFIGKYAYIFAAFSVIYMLTVVICDKVIYNRPILGRWVELIVALVQSAPWVLVLRIVIKRRVFSRDQLNLFFSFYLIVLLFTIVFIFMTYLDTGELKYAFSSPVMLITMLLLSKYNQQIANKGEELDEN